MDIASMIRNVDGRFPIIPTISSVLFIVSTIYRYGYISIYQLSVDISVSICGEFGFCNKICD